MLPQAIIIDVVFIPIYFLLLLGAIFDLIRHGRGRKAGYVQLVLFTSIRVVGSVLLTAAWCSHTTKVSVYVAGFLLQSFGYSFLLTSCLALYQQASCPLAGFKARARSPAGILSVLSLWALILLIVGYTNYDGFADPSLLSRMLGASSSSEAGSSLPHTAQAGNVLFVIATAGLIALVTAALHSPSTRLNMESRQPLLLVRGLAVATPFLLARTVYSTYVAFSDHPLASNVWAKLVLLNVCEVIAATVLIGLGILVDRSTRRDQDEEGAAPGAPGTTQTPVGHDAEACEKAY
ncbi:unnamed protein product [Jaminaea pallidilutea]